MVRLTILLFLSGCFYESVAQLTYNELFVDYDSTIEYKNLKLIPIRKKPDGARARPILSFGKAFRSGEIVVSERGTASTENVHWLRVNNNSGKPVFIASGEIVVGGRQDRMITKDTIIQSQKGDQYIPVMCVEEGRWSDKERKFSYTSYANPRLRKVLDQSRNQVLVWKEIYNQLDSTKTKSPTLAYAAKRIDKKHILFSDEYVRYFSRAVLQADTSIVGFVCMSGNKIIGSDIFSDINLFRDQFESLLSGYIEQAINFGSPNRVTDEAVKKYLDQFLTDQPTQDAYLRKNGKIFRNDGRVFHITSY